MRVIVLFAVLLAGCAPATPPAELILRNGRILTVDAADSVAEAVAISNGRIAAVGTDREIGSRRGPQTQVVDLQGRTATPGLIDSHVHFQEAEALYSINLSDPGIQTIDDVLARVREQAARLKPGEWVRGGGWDDGKFAERRYLRASDLDKTAPANPVWLSHTSGHFGTANSMALRLAGISASTKNPAAGTIDRDAAGSPTGVMKESAMQLITKLIPPLTPEQQRTGLLQAIADFNKEDMTGAKDPGIDPEKWTLYKQLLGEDKLTVRVFALWNGGRTVESANEALANIRAAGPPLANFGDGRLISGGVKIFMDGAVLAHTAWVYDEWFNNANEKDTNNFGYPTTEPSVYQDMVRLLHDAGIHVSTHAIGDRAIDWVVDTYDQVLRAKPTRGLRHGIIHSTIPTDHAMEVMARLQKEYDAAYPETQAPFMWWLGDNLIRSLGPARAARVMPFKSYLDRGIRWAGGSDYFVTPYPARHGVWASAARETLKGTFGATPFGTAESVDIRASLRSYTIWAAHQLFLEDRIGSIEPGKDADIAVWDRDLYTASRDDLKNLRCVMTLFRGKLVYEAK